MPLGQPRATLRFTFGKDQSGSYAHSPLKGGKDRSRETREREAAVIQPRESGGLAQGVAAEG